MLKLTITTLFALLLPIFWVLGAKAEINHQQAWTQTADESKMQPAQLQTYRLRAEISQRLTAMSNLTRIGNSSSSFLGTARELIRAAEAVQNESNLTSDYYAVENSVQKVRILHSALQVLSQLN